MAVVELLGVEVVCPDTDILKVFKVVTGRDLKGSSVDS